MKNKVKELLNEESFREALDKVPAYVYLKDLESRYVSCNQLTLKLFGCSAEEVIGCNDTDFFPPDAVDRLRKVDLRVFAGETTNEEIEVVDKKAGRVLYLEVKSPIYEQTGSKKIKGLLGISTDITDRKNAEDALKIRNEEIEKINKAFVGRELKMIELKEEIKELKKSQKT